MTQQPCQPYLLILNSRLRSVIACWNPDRLDIHTKFIMNHLAVDKTRKIAGFRGRAGDMDMYYTAFALRALGLCRDAMDEKLALGCGNFSRYCKPANAIDLLSQLFCLWLCDGKVPEKYCREAKLLLEKLARSDGGYAKSPTAGLSSTYHTFLAMLSWDMLCEKAPNAEKTLEFILSRQCADGGFAEGENLQSGSVNPTAAATAIMVSSGIITGDALEKAVRFLLDAQTPSGGWRAAAQAPIADLLSSFTAALTLADLGQLGNANIPAAKDFLGKCTRPTGGFGAWADDPQSDVEYCFYGLGMAAILDSAELV